MNYLILFTAMILSFHIGATYGFDVGFRAAHTQMANEISNTIKKLKLFMENRQ